MYLKLQPYRQQSPANTFEVVERIGAVAYKLDLPERAFGDNQENPLPINPTPDLELQDSPTALVDVRRIMRSIGFASWF